MCLLGGRMDFYFFIFFIGNIVLSFISTYIYHTEYSATTSASCNTISELIIELIAESNFFFIVEITYTN